MDGRIGIRRLALLTALFVLAAMPSCAEQRHGDGLDNVLEYVPYVAVASMKVCGADSRDEWAPFATKTLMSFAVTAGVAYALKHTVKEWRPDDSDRHAFPSGHAAVAFAGATVLHHEYGHLSPWISIGGYAIATATAIDRVCRDRHYWHDVAAGACIGFLSVELSFFVTDKIFPREEMSVSIGAGGVRFAYAF